MNAPVDIRPHPANSRLGIIDCDVHPYPKAGALNNSRQIMKPEGYHSWELPTAHDGYPWTTTRLVTMSIPTRKALLNRLPNL